MRRADILVRYQYTTKMLIALTPILTYYIDEGGDKQRLIDLVNQKFSDRDNTIEKKIASAR
jgi:hypothetical protein